MPNKTYSDLLHDSAALWGLPVPPDRPLIDDHTSPYPKRLQVVETFQWHAQHGWERLEIEIVFLNGRWAFAGNYRVADGGGGFPPCPKFCHPLPTRAAAIAAAICWLRRLPLSDAALAWTGSLLSPQQLSLF